MSRVITTLELPDGGHWELCYENRDLSLSRHDADGRVEECPLPARPRILEVGWLERSLTPHLGADDALRVAEMFHNDHADLFTG